MSEFQFSNSDNKQWSRRTKSNVWSIYARLGKKYKKLMILSADLGRSSGLDRFKTEFPEKYLSVGIGEQNMIGVASGLGREGYKVFVTSFAIFKYEI